MTSKKKVKPPAEDGILFEAFVEKFLVHLEKLGSSRASVFWYALDLGIARKFFGKGQLLSELTEREVAEYLESDPVTKTRDGRPKAPVTIDRTRRALRIALEWAAGEALIEKSPIPAKPAKEKKS